LYRSSNVQIDDSVTADGVPRILVDRAASLAIGPGVELRSGVEIRVHGTARVIIEEGVRIDRGVRILAANKSVLRIGKGTRIGLYSVFNGGESITIGEKVLISGFVYLLTSMHAFERTDIPIRDQGYTYAPLKIEDGAWLGAHVTVFPGLVLGRGAIVGSNAVVTHDVAPRGVVAGVPARPLRRAG
jgi:acetyltransferase-like isoleucine patch superfamily enzyme